MTTTPQKQGDDITHNHHMDMTTPTPMPEKSEHMTHSVQASTPDHTHHMDGMSGGMDHSSHAGHGVMHEGHATMMRNRFFVSLPLTIIVLLYSPMIQNWF